MNTPRRDPPTQPTGETKPELPPRRPTPEAWLQALEKAGNQRPEITTMDLLRRAWPGVRLVASVLQWLLRAVLKTLWATLVVILKSVSVIRWTPTRLLYLVVLVGFLSVTLYVYCSPG